MPAALQRTPTTGQREGEGVNGDASEATTYQRPSDRPKAPDALTHARFKVRLVSGVAMQVLTDQRHGYVRARIWRDGPCGCGNTEAEAVDDLLRMYPGAAREDVAAP